MDNSNLKFLIVEDNLSYSIELEMLIEKLGYHVLSVTDNSAEALELIYADKPDFILMDIDIKGKLSGLDIAEHIQNTNIPILFLSSFTDKEYTQRAEAINAVGYLTKPISVISLQTAIRMAIKNLYLLKGGKEHIEDQEDGIVLDQFLFFKKKSVYHKVQLSDIYLLHAESGYTTVFTDNQKYVTRNSLSYFEGFLNPKKYKRISRSHIIAMDKIQSIDFHENTLQILDKTISLTKISKRDLMTVINKMD